MTQSRNWFIERFVEAHIALMFLSRIPTGRVSEPVPTIASATWAFPLVGALIGCVGALGYVLSIAADLPPAMAGIIALALMIAVSGAIHEDGLADLADGLGGGRDVAHKLSIMRDSNLGSYGVLTLILALSLRGLAIMSLADIVVVASSIIALAIASRSLMVLGLYFMPSARSDGLGQAASRVSLSRTVIASACGLVALIALSPYWLVVLVCMMLGAALIGWLAWRQIGGQTGDVLGAMQQCSEIAGWVAIVSCSAS
ncbi:MAG: adenosylcobinamide-GDP ribazoletransferase [Hyphomicrobiaceae bacterium]|jgi:adenosylcobinamide-GDP ribazoletransferase